MNEIKDLLNKSLRSLEVAKQLVEQGHYDFAASRAYYALFYGVEALLLNKDLSFSKHKGVIAAFAKHFVKTGIFPAHFHETLRKAFDMRIVGDYASEFMVTEEEAKTLIEKALNILKAINSYLERA